MPRVRRVRPGRDPGITRSGEPGDHRHHLPTGEPVDAATEERIASLVIPPAWTEVWVSTDPLGHIQAVGTDDDGRRQYLYHPQWQLRRERDKYDRALALAAALPRARARVTRALREEGMSQEKVMATAFRALDLTGLRMGYPAHLRRSGNRGLITLQRRHVRSEPPEVTLAFRGKGGKDQLLTVVDEDLAATVSALLVGSPRVVLLSWKDGRRRRSVTPARLNAYLADLTGGRFTAKDLRTLRGTIVAARSLAEHGPATGRRDRAAAERAAVQAVAEALGNTPSVARASYIDPRVFARYRRGRLLDLGRTPESALRTLVLGPERGARRRTIAPSSS